MNATNQRSEGAAPEIVQRQTYRMAAELDFAVRNSLRDWGVKLKRRFPLMFLPRHCSSASARV